MLGERSAVGDTNKTYETCMTASASSKQQSKDGCMMGTGLGTADNPYLPSLYVRHSTADSAPSLASTDFCSRAYTLQYTSKSDHQHLHQYAVRREWICGCSFSQQSFNYWNVVCSNMQGSLGLLLGTEAPIMTPNGIYFFSLSSTSFLCRGD